MSFSSKISHRKTWNEFTIYLNSLFGIYDMTNKFIANTVLEYSRKGSDTTLPINTAPLELQELWDRGNRERISMIKIRKLQERYETRDGRSFRVHNYGKISLNEVLPKSLRTGKKGDEVQFNEKIKLGESNPTMAILRVPSNYKSNPNFNRDIESSFKALNLDRGLTTSSFKKFLNRFI